MKVSELIEWLKTQDQDAIVQVVDSSDIINWQYCPVLMDFSTEEYLGLWEYVDFKGNPIVKKSDSFYNKSYLLLGRK